MQNIIDLLQSHSALPIVWRGVLWIAAGYLFILGLTIFVRRDIALGFLHGFASTVAFNTLEAVLRFVAGLAFMGASTEMQYPLIAFVFGAILSVTAIAMLLLPMAHRRYGKWAIKFVTPILPFVGISSIALGGFLIFLMH